MLNTHLALFRGRCQAALGLALALMLMSIPCVAADDVAGERLSLNKGWLFHLGDIPFPEVKTHLDSYNHAKAGSASGAAAVDYDDSHWRTLDLPHDWVVEGPFDPNENVAQGYRPRGVAWYRRHFQMNESERGLAVELQFDAIATHATIWVNGHLVRRSWSGYSASYIDITPYLYFGDKRNVIAVRVDANAMEGWWYEGGGIYRHTWLVKRNPVHILTDGINAVPRALDNHRWSLPVALELYNSGNVDREVKVAVNLFDPNGRRVSHQRTRVHVPVLGTVTAELPMQIKKPLLWSIDTPHLYRIEATIETVAAKGELPQRDTRVLHTGFRRIRFDPKDGFFLNDQHLKLQGVCIHQDHAGVGVALPDAIWDYRLRRLKELGVNTIRFAHAAPAAEVLDKVDRMGFVVMDENRNFNISPDYMAQLEWMLRRDRHHPSIIMWSVFNEEPVQGSEVGYEMVRRMTAAVKKFDTTRPVTAAMNGGFFSPLNVSHGVDLVGFNYQLADYDRYHQANPEKPFTSSEDTSAFMTRGAYVTDKTQQVIAAYDDEAAPWGNSHRDAWQAIATRDFVAGGFVWTGFDYRGEPTPFTWPSVNSFFGIMDLNGFAKTAYYLHQVQWIKDRPLVHVAPHWNWAGKEGEPIRVMVMSNTERVRLSLNGQPLGEQTVDPFRMNFFTVPYVAGKLDVVGYRDGQAVAQASVETTGEPVALELIPDRDGLKGDGVDAMPITVRALDARGRPVPTADALARFTISRGAKIIGHGNGDPNSHEDEKGPTRKLFNGLAQLLVQSDGEQRTEVEITAASPGLRSAVLRLPVREAAPPPAVPPSSAATLVDRWQVSPAFHSPPDPHLDVAANDMNSWRWSYVPALDALPSQDANTGKVWRLYRAELHLRKAHAQGAAQLRFRGVLGKAEVWLDQQRLGVKASMQQEDWVLPLPAGAATRRITLVLQGNPGELIGLQGPLLVEPKTIP